MCLSTCLNVLVGLEEGGGCVLVCARVCVCVLEKKKNSLCYRLRSQLRSETDGSSVWFRSCCGRSRKLSIPRTPDDPTRSSAGSSDVWKTMWSGAPGRFWGRWRHHQQMSVACFFRTWVCWDSDLGVSEVFLPFDTNCTTCGFLSWWCHRPLKPAALSEASDKLVTLDFSSSVYSVHSPTSISQSNVWKQITLQDWNSFKLRSDLPASGSFFGKSSSSAADDERLLPRLTARGQHRCEIGRAAANHMSRL